VLDGFGDRNAVETLRAEMTEKMTGQWSTPR
jgi:hypothetical protein